MRGIYILSSHSRGLLSPSIEHVFLGGRALRVARVSARIRLSLAGRGGQRDLVAALGTGRDPLVAGADGVILLVEAARHRTWNRRIDVLV